MSKKAVRLTHDEGKRKRSPRKKVMAEVTPEAGPPPNPPGQYTITPLEMKQVYAVLQLYCSDSKSCDQAFAAISGILLVPNKDKP